jgi:hypothetical protein
MGIKQPYEIDIGQVYLKILIYGQPGIGKSTLALSMPNPVHIDADGGVRRVNPSHRVPTLQVSSYDEVLAVVNGRDLDPYETIVIDTAGKLLDYINSYVVRQNPAVGNRDGTLGIKGWGVRALTFEALIKTITAKNKHLLFVAHEQEERDGDTKVTRPHFGGGKAGGDLIRDLDLVGYMEAIGKNRTLSFHPCERYYAKNAARISDVLQIPALGEGDKNNFLCAIVEKCQLEMGKEAARTLEYHALMAEVAEEVMSVNDKDSANVAIVFIGQKNHFWDSRIKSWKALKERCDDLGLQYSPEQKIFYVPETKINAVPEPNPS